MNDRIKVAIIYGGRGFESEVSCRGKEHILPILEKSYHTYPIFIDKDGRWLTCGRQIFAAYGGFIFESGERLYVDCAIPLLHGDYGEDGVVQGALENARIPYIGCDTICSAVCRDKTIVKAVAKSFNIPTLPCLTVCRGDEIESATRLCEEEFGYPLFIKPTRLGSSIGVARADNKTELWDALHSALRLCDRVMIEPCLTHKRELECGYFSAGGVEICSHPGEVLIDGVYDYDGKYKSNTSLAVRADIPRDVARAIQDYSLRLARALGIRHISRIDYFLSDGRLYFNEINSMPGFTDGSLYPRMIEAEGICESELFSRLIDEVRPR